MGLIDTSTEQKLHTLREIFSQPDCWEQCLKQLATSKELGLARQLAKPNAEWILIGCGSSYYLALVAAATFTRLGLLARAIPASELVLYPDLILPKERECVAVLISRSGLTSEVLQAARMLQSRGNLPRVAITCAAGQPLESHADVTLRLTPADEQSMVMTRSFTSMLLGLQYLAASVSANVEFSDALMRLPGQVRPLLARVPATLRDFVSSRSYQDYVFLGQGPLFGIANEAMLKVTESSCSYAQVFHSMEFRHGPKSIAGPGTLITFFLSESSYEAELEVLEEMQQLGSAILVVGNRIEDRTRGVANFVIELGLNTPEYTRLTAYAIWGQLLGVYTGLQKGLNPDAPRNLSRVVVLDS